MPRPKNKFDRTHLLNQQRYQKQIEDIYKAAINEAAAIGVSIENLDPDTLFRFNDFPQAKARADKMLASLRSQMQMCIVNGVRSEWTLANNKNNELANAVFGDNVGKLTQAQYRRYYSTNGKALDAFLARKEQGLDLSKRVWNYADAYREELELGLDVGIRTGLDAAEMARDLQQYLKHPDKLFRRVRDEHGGLQLSQAAKAFHPGQGVYRSSYMNARRLAATETNIAYRTADHLRWQQMDFVLGIEIHLSNNHNCKGVPAGMFFDICDELQGKYPKDFKFTGWHPHCRCYATPILPNTDSFEQYQQAMLEGEDVTDWPFEGEVTSPPSDWFDWLRDNRERAKTAYSVPYFLRDNERFIPKGYIKLYASRMPYDTFAEYEEAMRFNKKNAVFTPEQRENIRELNKVMPVVQGKVMNITEANEGKVNPLYGTGRSGYGTNCATCVPTYVLRRRGFNINAGENLGKGKVYELSQHALQIWKRADGSSIDFFDDEVIRHNVWAAKRTHNQSTSLKSFIENNADEPGIYMVRLGWNVGGGHFTVVELTAERNYIYYDPQSGKKKWIDRWISQADLNHCWMMRVDDKLIDPNFAECFVKAQ